MYMFMARLTSFGRDFILRDGYFTFLVACLGLFRDVLLAVASGIPGGDTVYIPTRAAFYTLQLTHMTIMYSIGEMEYQ